MQSSYHRHNDALTRLAAQRLEEIRNGSLTVEVREKASLCLLDYLGALISGLRAPWAPMLLQYARNADPGHRQACHVVGLERPVSAEVAAFTNASIAHSIIRDDIHLGAGAHIGVMVIPAALALAEHETWTGDQLLKGIVGGYEMAIALGVSIRHSGLVNPHFRPSGIVGAFGAAGVGIAGTAANADGNSKENRARLSAATNALGFAANMSAGLNEWPWVGGTEINTQMGTASRAGITSLYLSRAGMHSSDTVLEGNDGLFMAYGCERDAAADKFRQWFTESDRGAGIMGASFKPVAGCNFIQTPVEVALRLREQLAGAMGQQINRIDITTTTMARDYPGCNNPGPFETVQQTKMSLQYGVSAALLFGRMDEFSYLQHDNPELVRLVGKCVLETDEAYDRALLDGKQPSRIAIYMEDGTEYQCSLPDVPWLDGEAVLRRFRQEAEAFLPRDTVNRILKECQGLGDRGGCKLLFEALATLPSMEALN